MMNIASSGFASWIGGGSGASRRVRTRSSSRSRSCPAAPSAALTSSARVPSLNTSAGVSIASEPCSSRWLERKVIGALTAPAKVVPRISIAYSSEFSATIITRSPGVTPCRASHAAIRAAQA